MAAIACVDCDSQGVSAVPRHHRAKGDIRIMKSVIALFVMVLAPASLRAAGAGAIAFNGGVSTDGDLVLAGSYQHPVLMNQLYVKGGLAFIDAERKQTVVVAETQGLEYENRSFWGITQVNLGMQLGDRLFVSPKVSYNWYGDHSSAGWGIAAGFLLLPAQRFSFGFFAAYDEADAWPDGELPWVSGITSACITFRFSLQGE
jgi:hypothetical protein